MPRCSSNVPCRRTASSRLACGGGWDPYLILPHQKVLGTFWCGNTGEGFPGMIGGYHNVENLIPEYGVCPLMLSAN